MNSNRRNPSADAKAGASSPPPACRARRKSVHNLFQPEAKPLDSGVTPLASVRAPRRPRTFLCLAAALTLGCLSVFADDNAPEALKRTNNAQPVLTRDYRQQDTNEISSTNSVATSEEGAVQAAAEEQGDTNSTTLQTNAPVNGGVMRQAAVPEPAATPPAAPTPVGTPQTTPARPQVMAPAAGSSTAGIRPGSSSAPSTASSQSSRGPDRNTRVSRNRGQPDIAAFRIISDRNIFDPNRRGGRASGGPRPQPKAVDSFALVGVMSYEKGTFAFFDGSSGQYKKALKAGDSIAGFKVNSIDANSVALSANGKELHLDIGSGMRREDGGQWQVSKQIEAFASAPASPSNSTPNISSSPQAVPSASDPGVNETLRRLMQRREQD